MYYEQNSLSAPDDKNKDSKERSLNCLGYNLFSKMRK